MAESDNQEMAQNARKYWSAEGYTEGGVIREVDYASQSGGLDPMFEGIKIVDTDTHITEAPDLFTSRATGEWKAKMPRVERVNGTDRWLVGDRDFGTLGGNVIRADNNKLLGRLAFPKLEQAHPGGHELKARLQAMDDMGVYAQICFQNSGVTQAGSLMSLGDPELALRIVQIYNDASAEFQEASGQRIFNMAHLPFWDQKALEAEAKRCHDIGLKGFVLPDTPERVGVPSFNHEYWTPFLEMCEATGMPLNFHLNAAIDPNTLTWEGFKFEQTLSVVATMFSIGNAATLGNWMVSGRLDRHPASRSASSRAVQAGFLRGGSAGASVPRNAADHARRAQETALGLLPRSFLLHLLVREGRPKHLLEIIGVDNVMFETDFPHPTSLYPGVQEHLKDVLGGHSPEVRRKVLQDNAVRLYNLPF
ncbi:amidohydrolase family protein [Novosphingobium panipatense]